MVGVERSVGVGAESLSGGGTGKKRRNRMSLSIKRQLYAGSAKEVRGHT